MGKKNRKLPWNWRDRIEIILDEEDDVYDFVLQFKDGKEAKGFPKKFGTLSVENEDPYFVSVVEIDKYFRRRGLGKKLYLAAIKKFGKLSTHYYDASEMAQRVWISVTKTFVYETNFWEGTLTVFYKKKKWPKN